ncbi:extracellular solute-binding protein [Jiella sonneratiae]|uniref:Extracellular solute-binding protein n=1 Tax=Jiella sonneratiae TaxID=2816856 RepID=A0ABS3J5A1_9HYPH|nr:extracellular solute-binding protein [Jiella sonneratiae]MBO0904843.1 extracellular solute-binding protein [Jiella sonneratiae]
MTIRSFRQAFAAGLALAALVGAPALAEEAFLDVGKQEPITILINSSPWYLGFESVVDLYTEQTGNEVKIDATPYGGVLEKARNAVRTSQSPYDILNLDSGWTIEFYQSDVLRPLGEIVDGYEMPKEVFTCGGSYFWNAEKHFRTAEGGKLMAVPPNCNTHVLVYRKDLMEKPPATWDEVLSSCQKVQDKPKLYGFATRGERGNGIHYDFMPFLLSYGGSIVKDPEAGDYTVTINSPEALQALEQFIKIEHGCAPDNVAAMGQGDVIQLMSAGSAAMVETVIAAWPNYVDPTRSAVVDTVAAAPMPEGPSGRGVAIGNWHFAIPRNIPDERAKAAMAFIQWFLTEQAQTAYAEGGGIPVRADVLEKLSSQPKFAWMAAYKTNLEAGKQPLGFAEGAAVEQVIGLRLNQALVGEMSPAAALNTAAKEIEGIFKQSGRNTGMLDPLSE